MAEVGRDPEVFLLDHVMHHFVEFVRVVTGVRAVRLNFECVRGCKVHSVEKTLDSSQLLPQPTLDEFSVLDLIQKVVSASKLHPKDVSVQPSDVPCNQISSGNLRTEVIVLVAAELVVEDVVVVVAAVHCHVFCSADDFVDPKNQCHDQSQDFRQLALAWFVE
jgi:hypothetical protein